MLDLVHYYAQVPGTHPEYKTEGAGAFDLYAVDGASLQPGEVHKIHTGLWIALPNQTMGLMAIRSSYSKKGLTLVNSVGYIDSDYRGEIIANVINLSNAPVELVGGHRFAQLAILPVVKPYFKSVPNPGLLTQTARGKGGFGSTGE